MSFGNANFVIAILMKGFDLSRGPSGEIIAEPIGVRISFKFLESVCSVLVKRVLLEFSIFFCPFTSLVRLIKRAQKIMRLALNLFINQ
ncbi:hypothetical protein TURTL08_18450 [Turicimonas sp. TL08]